MTAAEAAALVVTLTRDLAAARRERDAEALRADRAAAAFEQQSMRLREAHVELARYRRRAQASAA